VLTDSIVDIHLLELRGALPAQLHLELTAKATSARLELANRRRSRRPLRGAHG